MVRRPPRPTVPTEMQPTPAPPRYGWTIAAVLVALALYLASLRADFYQLTSPFELPWHVTLRKIYSVGAFALVAFLARRALFERGFRPTPRGTILIGALFSAAIEIGQYRMGSQEGLGWNAFDIFCGALGGGASLIAIKRKKRPAKPRPQAILRPRRRDLRE